MIVSLVLTWLKATTLEIELFPITKTGKKFQKLQYCWQIKFIKVHTIDRWLHRDKRPDSICAKAKSGRPRTHRTKNCIYLVKKKT